MGVKGREGRGRNKNRQRRERQNAECNRDYGAGNRKTLHRESHSRHEMSKVKESSECVLSITSGKTFGTNLNA